MSETKKPTTLDLLKTHETAQAVQATVRTPVLTPAEQFDRLVATAPVIDGRDIVKPANLIGVPFLITGATIRDGVRRAVGGGKSEPTNYVSVELTVGSKGLLEKALRRGRITQEQFDDLDPYEALVINDGSTGICRQIVAHLHDIGAIQVPAGDNDGPAGASRWDIYRADWLSDRDLSDDPHFSFELMCPRGTRKSDYENDFGDATTHYLG